MSWPLLHLYSGGTGNMSMLKTVHKDIQAALSTSEEVIWAVVLYLFIVHTCFNYRNTYRCSLPGKYWISEAVCGHHTFLGYAICNVFSVVDSVAQGRERMKPMFCNVHMSHFSFEGHIPLIRNLLQPHTPVVSRVHVYRH